MARGGNRPSAAADGPTLRPRPSTDITSEAPVSTHPTVVVILIAEVPDAEVQHLTRLAWMALGLGEE